MLKKGFQQLQLVCFLLALSSQLLFPMMLDVESVALPAVNGHNKMVLKLKDGEGVISADDARLSNTLRSMLEDQNLSDKAASVITISLPEISLATWHILANHWKEAYMVTHELEDDLIGRAQICKDLHLRSTAELLDCLAASNYLDLPFITDCCHTVLLKKKIEHDSLEKLFELPGPLRNPLLIAWLCRILGPIKVTATHQRMKGESFILDSYCGRGRVFLKSGGNYRCIQGTGEKSYRSAPLAKRATRAVVGIENDVILTYYAINNWGGGAVSREAAYENIVTGDHYLKKKLDRWFETPIECVNNKILIDKYRSIEVWDAFTANPIATFNHPDLANLYSRRLDVKMVFPCYVVIRCVTAINHGPKEGTTYTWDNDFIIWNFVTNRTIKCGPLQRLKIIVKHDKIFTLHYDHNKETVITLWNPEEGDVFFSHVIGRVRYEVKKWLNEPRYNAEKWMGYEPNFCVNGTNIAFFISALFLWNLESNSVMRLEHPHTRAVDSFEDKIISCARDGSVCIWNAQTGERLATYLGISPLRFSVKWVKVITGDRLVISGRKDYIVDLALLRSLHTMDTKNARAVMGYAFSLESDQSTNWQEIARIVSSDGNKDINSNEASEKKCVLQ